MQELQQKISPIKERILIFANTLGISKREFYNKIQVSRGTLESRTGITEDILAKFIATYPEVSIEWLLTRERNMLSSNNAHLGLRISQLLTFIGQDFPKSDDLDILDYTSYLLGITRQEIIELNSEGILIK